MRTIIAGGPLTGKSTAAEKLRVAQGLDLYLCTDTLRQAGNRSVGKVLHTPSQFDNDWSGLSEWVALHWLTKPDPWILEGVAAVRALRKYRARHGDDYPPCDRVLWLTKPKARLSDGQATMESGHETMMDELLDTWPELLRITTKMA
jgi:hypothetical protein